jgi:hypothetical protein
MPLGLQFPDQIVNVQWGDKLAVEFPGGANYLENQGPAISSFQKAVVSFWFRVPQTSLDLIKADLDDRRGISSVLVGTLPIITFGPVPNIVQEDGPSAPASPSFIGIMYYTVQATDDDPDPPPAFAIAINLQFTVFPSNSVPAESDENWRPDWFLLLPMKSGSAYETAARTLDVTPDKWHHLLFSCDFSGTSSGTASVVGGTPENPFTFEITSACNFWVAFDDVDYPYFARDDPFYSVGTGSEEPHKAATARVTDCITGAFHTLGSATTSTTPGTLPVASNLIGVPSDGGHTNQIYQVQLAELQFFTDVILDTSSQDNRRAFIAQKKDEDGNETGPLKPVDPKKAKELLGKEPDTMLHGQSNWIDGKNTGSKGYKEDSTDGDREEDPEGQFEPTGEIKKYSPDPSIEV